ncbi:MAG: hypothetical protein JSR37_05110 [Verrucomicrobia bacterium]|nr:hypothetical protein [Verrucomicrobiota bacterium]
MSFYIAAASFISTSYAALSNKAKSLPCTQEAIGEAMRQIADVAKTMDTSTTEGMKKFMVKVADAQNFVSGCLGMPTSDTILKGPMRQPIPHENLAAMLSKLTGHSVKMVGKPIHISQARDFVANQATTVAKTVAKTATTVLETTVQESTPEPVSASLSLLDQLGGAPVVLIGLTALGLSAYAIHRLWCSSKTKTV